MSDHLTQKEIKKPDAFESFLYNAADYIYRRKKAFTAGAGAFVIVLGAIYGTYTYQENQNIKRSEALYQIEKQLQKESGQKVLPSLKSFADKNKDSEQAVIAHFYQGNILRKGGKLDKAAEEFRTVIKITDKESTVKVLAAINLANTLREQKKFDEAIEVLSNFENTFLPDVQLIELAETYLEKGDNLKAKQKLEILLKEYPQSPYLNQAKLMMLSL